MISGFDTGLYTMEREHTATHSTANNDVPVERDVLQAFTSEPQGLNEPSAGEEEKGGKKGGAVHSSKDVDELLEYLASSQLKLSDQASANLMAILGTKTVSNASEGAGVESSTSTPSGLVSSPAKNATKLMQQPVAGSLDDPLLKIPTAYGAGGVLDMKQTSVLECPKAMVGRVIGKGGETIKSLQQYTGAMIQIDQSTDPTRVTIAGSKQSVQLAIAMVSDIVNGRFKGFAMLRQIAMASETPGGQATQPVYVQGYGFMPPSQSMGAAASAPPIGLGAHHMPNLGNTTTNGPYGTSSHAMFGGGYEEPLTRAMPPQNVLGAQQQEAVLARLIQLAALEQQYAMPRRQQQHDYAAPSSVNSALGMLHMPYNAPRQDVDSAIGSLSLHDSISRQTHGLFPNQGGSSSGHDTSAYTQSGLPGYMGSAVGGQSTNSLFGAPHQQQ
jgi:predicted RNA-binding protein YlqC (UPF0109 family)